MPQTFSKFGKTDYAKYPFLKAARRYLIVPDLDVRDLEDEAFANIVLRAEERLRNSILFGIVDWDPKIDDDIESMSFIVAIILAIATDDSFIKKRYALSEANRAYALLINEHREKLVEFAKDFGWTLLLNSHTDQIPYEFSVKFVNYLRNTIYLRDMKWKLVNRILSEGRVFLGRDEIARLLKEETYKRIEERFTLGSLPNCPRKISKIAEEIKQLALDTIGKTEMEGYPKEVMQNAFPPCINALFQAFTSGRHLSHVGRFTLTSFLVNIGMPPEKLIELFKNVSDFNERMTRYQVEHIAGEKGSRTRYIPPKCDTLKTHSVCINPDDLCRRIYHPLTYYRRKLKA
jgi:DNA primase large subunit